MSRPRALLQNLILMFLTSCLILFFAEIGFRIFYSAPQRLQPNSAKVLIHESSSNMKLLYRPAPNAVKEAYWAINHINRDGFRDRDFDLIPLEGTRRILFLGDSVVYGYGIQSESTIPKQLEKEFHKKGGKIEVLNLGVSGYETEQAVEFFKEVGLKYHPDIVIVGYTLNDSMYASMELDFFNDRAHWKVPGYFKWYEKIPHFLYRHSRIVQYMNDKLLLQNEKAQIYFRGEKSIWRYIRDRNKERQDPPDSEYRLLKNEIIAEAGQKRLPPEEVKTALSFIGIDNYEMQSSHWNVSKQAFRDLKKLSEQYDFKVAVVIFPYLGYLDRYPLGPLHRYLQKELEGFGFLVFDSLEFLGKAHQQYGPEIQKDPIHFSALGASLMGKYLFEKLSDLPAGSA